MKIEHVTRRTFLKTAVAAGGTLCLDPVRLARAMGTAGIPQGFREIEGSVLLNGQPAREGDPVRPGDVVETGPGARAVFVAGRDAYLLRADTRLAIPPGDEGKFLARLNLEVGALMGVFGGRGRRLETPTAVAGIRGTGVYLEAEPGRTYLCACYGRVRVRAVESGEERVVRTWHHDRPLYVLGEGVSEERSRGGEWIADAGMKNHADSELRRLEALVGRVPPFDRDGAAEGGGRY
jgi:hypothetical protein